MKFILKPGQLTIHDLHLLLDDTTTIELSDACHQAIQASEQVILQIIKQNKVVYGVNTGFGALASTRISTDDLNLLQRSIVLSHAAGTGEYLNDAIVRLIIALKINSLARGYSGVRYETIDALVKLYNHQIYPCIPSQGSVGASGDLAPLAHLCTVLLGFSEARYQGRIISAEEALAIMKIKPLELGPKEGLALLNGTQVSTAIALYALFKIESIFIAAIGTGALSVDAMRASDTPFDARIHAVRGHPSQIKVAALLRNLLNGSDIRKDHLNCDKVQDPYSLRCQPQVMGACLTSIEQAAATLLIEANGVSDNPLVFVEQNEVLSGGNFHAEPVALAADALAVSIAEIGALSERRTALLIDPHFSHLPAFLVKNPGLNSGFMLAQVTAAALASENKSLAHPASVDSIPTSANQEDHVSMATFAARRLLTMIENTACIIGIELLCASQGIDFQKPLTTSPSLEQLHELIRKQVPFYEQDRYLAPDIEIAKMLVYDGKIQEILGLMLFS